MPEKHGRSLLRLLLACVFTLVCALSTQGQTFKVLYNFTGGTDGAGPWGSLVLDKLGNLYGTTAAGGAYGDGEVFEVSPNADGTWTESVIHSFLRTGPEGFDPMSNLIIDAAGNLYGTAMSGGLNNTGTAFELTPGSSRWSLTLLYTFNSYKGDAAGPEGGLIMDAQGNLYGMAGGGNPGPGAIYELSPGVGGWTETVLYSFGTDLSNGYGLLGSLIFDAAGNLYGTTFLGGDLSCDPQGYGCGVVFRLTPTRGGWKENVLYRFTGAPKDGNSPAAQRLAFDSMGRLYGTTLNGGGAGCQGSGCGSIFRLIHSHTGWNETLVHTFGGGLNGAYPTSGLTFDQAGNAYGVAGAGGGAACDCGVVFKLAPGANGKWTYSVLHAFQGSDGTAPESGVILDSSGNMYGTTVLGGSSGFGVVYEIIP
jgi:uncharacterized repeat protein (TIGR03803 family)